MQIVIDIPNNMDLRNYNIPYDILKIITDGTPLPKGHGRLIDANDALDYFTTNMYIIDENDERLDSDVERRKIYKDYFDGITTVLDAEEV